MQPQTQINRVVIAEPRPKVKIGLALVLCCLYFFPGVIYICAVKKKQRDWDKLYGR